MSFDFAYSHVFVEDANFSRDVATQAGLIANGNRRLSRRHRLGWLEDEAATD